MQLNYTAHASLKPNLQAHFQVQGRRIKMQFIRAVTPILWGQYLHCSGFEGSVGMSWTTRTF